MLFKVIMFFQRLLKVPPVKSQRTSVPEGQERTQTEREREELERRLSYLEAQAEVYARKDLR